MVFIDSTFSTFNETKDSCYDSAKVIDLPKNNDHKSSPFKVANTYKNLFVAKRGDYGTGLRNTWDNELDLWSIIAENRELPSKAMQQDLWNADAISLDPYPVALI